MAYSTVGIYYSSNVLSIDYVFAPLPDTVVFLIYIYIYCVLLNPFVMPSAAYHAKSVTTKQFWAKRCSKITLLYNTERKLVD